MKTAATLTLMLALASSAQAVTTYSLANDFSNTMNPNGVWSFKQGTVTLSHYTTTGGNLLNTGVANGLWGVGSNLDVAVPFVAKTTLSGGQLPLAAGSSNADFLANQVIVHSPNAGDSLFINWTAPGPGSIQYSATAWYAHSPVDRANDILVALNGTSLSGPFEITEVGANASNETNRVAIGGSTSYTVAAGDVLSFEIRKQSGQQYGSITGLDETVLFTAAPVPEPATYGLMLAGLAGVAAVARRRAATSPH